MKTGGISAGVLLMVAGAWVLTQILGGNALGRLGVSGAPTTPGQVTNGSGGGAGGGGGGSW